MKLEKKRAVLLEICFNVGAMALPATKVCYTKSRSLGIIQLNDEVI